MNGQAMDDDLLRTTLRVARAGSFAAAARETGVDPSSVSRHVAALEEAVNIRIFDRTTRRLDLTEAGRLYLDRAAPALDALDEAADVARDVMTEPSGTLRVTTSVAFGERWLVPRLAAFRSAYPRIDLDLILTDAMTDLAQDGIDVALRLGPRPETGSMVAAKLFDTPYRVVASPDYLARRGHPQNPQELAEHDGLLFRLPAFQSPWQFTSGEGRESVEARPKPALKISNALALRRAALSGMGVALLADWTIRSDLEDRGLVDLFPQVKVSVGGFDSGAWIVYLSRSYVPTRLRVFIDHLKERPSDVFT